MSSLFDMDSDGKLTISVEAYSLLPFQKIWTRDKSKNKTVALKELAFIFFYCDIKSNYMITPEEFREKEISRDIGLKENWKIDTVVKEAIEYYNKHSKSIIAKLYEASIQSANDVADYLNNTKVLLEERDDKGKPVTTISTITTGLKSIPVIMRDLRSAYKEVIKETSDNDDKKKGKQQYNTFETGLVFE
jgi:hypothetical protein